MGLLGYQALSDSVPLPDFHDKLENSLGAKLAHPGLVSEKQ